MDPFGADPFGADADDAFAVFDGKTGIKRELEGTEGTDPKRIKGAESITDGLLSFGAPSNVKEENKTKEEEQLDEIAGRERDAKRR